MDRTAYDEHPGNDARRSMLAGMAAAHARATGGGR